MSTGRRPDPYLGFRFAVEIDSLIVGGFAAVEGLEVEVDTEPYEEGGVNDYTHVLPSRTNHETITLRRGLTDADELWGWLRDTQHGRIERRNGRVLVLDTTGEEAFGWEFVDAFPVRWRGPEFSADDGAVAIEVLELAHEGLHRHGGTR